MLQVRPSGHESIRIQRHVGPIGIPNNASDKIITWRKSNCISNNFPIVLLLLPQHPFLDFLNGLTTDFIIIIITALLLKQCGGRRLVGGSAGFFPGVTSLRCFTARPNDVVAGERCRSRRRRVYQWESQSTLVNLSNDHGQVIRDQRLSMRIIIIIVVVIIRYQ